VVAASDVCLAPLQKSLKCPVIPSKILGYMSAGRPVVASLPLDGDAPRVINDAECGICVEPGDPHKLGDAILHMYQERKQCDVCGKNGRKYILVHHDREICVLQYERIFSEMIRHNGQPAAQ
jgi:glycosyltransferase involved in cell wall biosynthesis